MKRVLFAVLLVAAPMAVLASDHFWLIGGGPFPRASEAQIEFNVTWVRNAIRQVVPDAVIHVFFANGSGDGPGTVEFLLDPGVETLRFDAIARVFREYEENRSLYRRHDIDEVEGSTEAATLLPEIGRQLAELKAGDQGMIIYNGHGSWNPDRSLNALRLLGESKLDVREFERMLSNVDPDVPIRFLFTQCYSGAFAGAAFRGAEVSLNLATGQRCGFFAESEDRLSEGCSASINIGDYRDYTTYFFAALTGTTRLGEPVHDRADWDEDGQMTPFDAHLHTIVHARNADLPRSTSEVFLERWQPWYLRWISTEELPDNLYGRAARALATSAALPVDGPALGVELDHRYNGLVAEIRRAQDQQRDAHLQMQAVQGEIQQAVAQRWPQLLAPFTSGYATIVANEFESVTNLIVSHTKYPSLVRLQEEVDALTIELVELDRDLSLLDRIRRTRTLARALAGLARHGSAASRASYEQLRSCEALPLGGS